MDEDDDVTDFGSGNRTFLPWRVGTGELTGEPLCGQEGEVESVAISSDGQCVVSCLGDGTIRTWYVKTGKEVIHLSCFYLPLCQTIISSSPSRNVVYDGYLSQL